MTIIEFAGWLVARIDSRAERVKRLAVELALEGDEVLASEECHGLCAPWLAVQSCQTLRCLTPPSTSGQDPTIPFIVLKLEDGP